MAFELEKVVAIVNEVAAQHKHSLEKLNGLLMYLEAAPGAAPEAAPEAAPVTTCDTNELALKPWKAKGPKIAASTTVMASPDIDGPDPEDTVSSSNRSKTSAFELEPDSIRATHLSCSRSLGALEQFDHSREQSSTINKMRAALKNLQEPHRSGMLARLVLSSAFDIIVSIIICLFIIFTILETNWSLQHGMEISDGPFAFHLARYLFEGAYMLEVALRLAVHRLYFFVNKDGWWNLLDFMVMMGFIGELLMHNATFHNPVILRTLRIAKALRRVFRIVRLTRYIADLKLMVKCVAGSLLSLAWCMMLMAGFSLAYAIFISQQFAGYLSQNPAISEKTKQEIHESFGSVQASVVSLFQCVSGGIDWGYEYLLVSSLGGFNSVVFLSYIAMVWFSLANIITGIFLQKAMHFAEPEAHDRVLAQFKANLSCARELASLFRMISGEADHISAKQLAACLEDMQVASFFQMRELDVTDIDAFLEVLLDEEGDGLIHLDTFVTGCLSLKGPARSIDLIALSHRLIKLDTIVRRALLQVDNRPSMLHQSTGLSTQAAKEQPSLSVAASPTFADPNDFLFLPLSP